MSVRLADEQFVLAAMLAWPKQNRWELDGLRADLFTPGPHRIIALAMVDVRDDQRRSFHWRRVRALLRRRGWACADDVKALVDAIGTSVGVTASMGRVHHAAQLRRVA